MIIKGDIMTTSNAHAQAAQSAKALAFQALHAADRAFIIPNPWDAGTARLLALLGFEALATTSAGFAFSAGRPDFSIGRDRMLTHVADIVAATDLPVSADLENGFGDEPDTVAETIRMAAAAGLAGGSIEDASGNPERPVYDIGLAAERIRAAAEVVRTLPFPFMLTARAENYLNGRPDLADTIARLQAFQEAGADVLYAPGLTRKEDIAAVVRAVDRLREGASLAFGGGIPSGFEAGCYVEPTLMVDVEQNMRVAREEIFGPVAAILPFDEFPEVMAKANDSIYGLAASIWTSDVKRAHRFARDIEAGIVWVNCFDKGDMTSPWGGFKQSGFGRDKGLDALEQYVQTKSVWFDLAGE